MEVGMNKEGVTVAKMPLLSEKVANIGSKLSDCTNEAYKCAELLIETNNKLFATKAQRDAFTPGPKDEPVRDIDAICLEHELDHLKVDLGDLRDLLCTLKICLTDTLARL